MASPEGKPVSEPASPDKAGGRDTAKDSETLPLRAKDSETLDL